MRLLKHRRGNPDPEYVEAFPTAPPLDSTYHPFYDPEKYLPPVILQGVGVDLSTPDNSIPEPSTIIVWSLLGGMGIIGWWRKRMAV
jgi:hypothetical protein